MLTSVVAAKLCIARVVICAHVKSCNTKREARAQSESSRSSCNNSTARAQISARESDLTQFLPPAEVNARVNDILGGS